MQFRVTAGALICAAALVCGFHPAAWSQEALTLEQYWNEPYRADDERASLPLLVEQLLDPASPKIAGLSTESSRAVHQEVVLRLIRDHAGLTGSYREAVGPVRTFLAQPHDPFVQALARSHLGFYEWHLGDLASAQNGWRDLGFLGDWMLIGPFDNERGSGFGAAHAVESTIDFTTDYVGKRNRVGWRRVAGLGRGGMMELGQLLRPNEESLGFLLTYVYVDQPTDAVLRVGSTGAYSIRFGTEEVMRRDVERRLHFDQDAVAVRLGPGWHPLLVKSGNTKGSWAFRARFTDVDGHPLALRCEAQLPDGAAVATTAQRLDVAASLGAMTLLESADPTAEALTLHGYVTSDRSAHDVNQHPDRDLFRRSLELTTSAIPAYLFAETFNRSITHSAEREENRWRLSLERVLERDPSFDRAHLDLASYYEQRFSNHTRAGEYVWPMLDRSNPPVRALALAAGIARARLGSVAAVEFEERRKERLLKSTPAPNLRRAEAASLQSQGQIREAEALLRTGLELDFVDLGMRRLLADIRVGQGDLDDARAILESITVAYPQHAEPHTWIAALEASRDQLPAALTAMDAAVFLAPQDASLHQRRGEYLLLAGQTQAGIAELKLALDLDPNQPRLREYVGLQSAGKDRFGDDYRIDAAGIIATALAAVESENLTHRILLDNTAVRIQQDGTTSRYQQFVAKIVNDQGTRSYDYYPVNYAFGEQWVEVTKARVHHSDGRTEDARIRNRDPEVREGEYPVWSTAWIDLPTLEVGDVIEIEYRQQDLRQSFFGNYFGDRVLFGDQVPIASRIYTVDAPSDKQLFFHSRGLPLEPETTEADGRKTWRWVTKDLEKIDPEVGMPPIVELAPVLEVSTFESWNDFSQWYYHLIRKQFESSEEIRAKVKELTASATTNVEKVRAIYDFVVTDVRYIAWEFGVHGFKPYSASTIFTRRFGDCKDKATLICTMLDEVGIDAYPVLISGNRNRPREDLSLPLVLHFNHCIAYVPDIGDGTGLFVDGTAEHHGVTQLPMMDRGAKVLVVRDDRGDIEEIPWNRPDEQEIDETVRVQIAADGSARITQKDEFTGDFAVSIRSALEIEGQRKLRLERIFGRRFPGAKVETVETSALDDLSASVWVKLEVSVPKYLDDTGDGMRLPSVEDLFATVAGISATATRENRKHELMLGNPSQSELSVEIELPPGFEASHIPKGFRVDTPQAEFEYTTEANGRTIKLTRRLVRKDSRVPVDNYSEYRDLVERVGQLASEKIVIRKVGEVD